MNNFKKVALSKIFFLFLIYFSFYNFSLFPKATVTYNLNGGRFGDHLLTYLRAAWIGYKYNIPVMYKPFKYSSGLMLDIIDRFDKPPFYFTIINLTSSNINEIFPDKEVLYLVSYFPESVIERKKIQSWKNLYFPVDWQDPGFRNYLKDRIKPTNNINTFSPPENYISIALHIREGGGFDSNRCFITMPFKFPPLQFYKDALLKTLSYFKDRSIYCYVFTDAKDPKKLINNLITLIGFIPEITFDYRKENNFHDSNVLEDFFSLFNFDILIRPDSNYSIIPSLLNDYAIVVSPKSFISKDKKIIADDINFTINDDLLNSLLDDNKFLKK